MNIDKIFYLCNSDNMASDIKQPTFESPPQSKKPNYLKLIFFIGVFLFLVIIIFGLLIFFKNKKSTTKNKGNVFSPTPTTSVENKINVPIETKYENPFSEKTQYENPFSNNTNPFDNLK